MGGVWGGSGRSVGVEVGGGWGGSGTLSSLHA